MGSSSLKLPLGHCQLFTGVQKECEAKATRMSSDHFKKRLKLSFIMHGQPQR